jgi:NADH-quinone oxidoreductase subunit C
MADEDGPDLPDDLPDSDDPDDFTEEQLETLLEHERKELPQDLRIVQAKYKSQKARAKMEDEEEEEEEDEGPSEEELERQRAREFADVRNLEDDRPEAVEDVAMQTDVPYVVADVEGVGEVLDYARRVLGYDHLACLTAADYEDRIEVVWNLYCYDRNTSLAVKAPVDRDDPEVPTATDLWKGANWFEREVFDLFGVRFDGHPNLKRIMMPDGWEGYPLRKDYNIGQEQYIGMDEQGNDVVTRSPEGGW